MFEQGIGGGAVGSNQPTHQQGEDQPQRGSTPGWGLSPSRMPIVIAQQRRVAQGIAKEGELAQPRPKTAQQGPPREPPVAGTEEGREYRWQ